MKSPTEEKPIYFAVHISYNESISYRYYIVFALLFLFLLLGQRPAVSAQ